MPDMESQSMLNQLFAPAGLICWRNGSRPMHRCESFRGSCAGSAAMEMLQHTRGCEWSACVCRYDQELQAVQAQAQVQMQELQGQLRMERQRREAAEAQAQQLRQSTGAAAARSPAGSRSQAGSPHTAGRQVAGGADSRLLGKPTGHHASGCCCVSSTPALCLDQQAPCGQRQVASHIATLQDD